MAGGIISTIEFDNAGMDGLTVRGVSGTLPGSFTLALSTDDGQQSVVIHTDIEPKALDIPIKIIKAIYGLALGQAGARRGNRRAVRGR